jgi:hypothetical protein
MYKPRVWVGYLHTNADPEQTCVQNAEWLSASLGNWNWVRNVHYVTQFALGMHKHRWKDLWPNSSSHFSFLLNDFSNQQQSNETIARRKSIASREDSTGTRNGERGDFPDVDKLRASCWWSATTSHQRSGGRWITAPQERWAEPSAANTVSAKKNISPKEGNHLYTNGKPKTRYWRQTGAHQCFAMLELLARTGESSFI